VNYIGNWITEHQIYMASPYRFWVRPWHLYCYLFEVTQLLLWSGM